MARHDVSRTPETPATRKQQLVEFLTVKMKCSFGSDAVPLHENERCCHLDGLAEDGVDRTSRGNAVGLQS